MASTVPLDGLGPTVVVDIDPVPETKAGAATDRSTSSSASPSRPRSKSRVPAVPRTPAPQPPPAAVAERRAVEEAERKEAERKEAEPKLREFDERLDGTPPPPPASRVSGVAASRAPQHGGGGVGGGVGGIGDGPAVRARAPRTVRPSYARRTEAPLAASASAAAAAPASASASESGSVGATIAAGGQHALRDSDAFDELLANGFVVETKEEGSGKRRPREGDVVQVKVETYVSLCYVCVRARVCVRVCMCVNCSYAPILPLLSSRCHISTLRPSTLNLPAGVGPQHETVHESGINASGHCRGWKVSWEKSRRSRAYMEPVRRGRDGNVRGRFGRCCEGSGPGRAAYAGG